MRTSLNINIPEPCQEDWNKMTIQEKGRHCSSCEKTVYDFTSKSDEQIVKTFLDQGKVCGRFKSTQLNRELVLTRKEKNNYLSYVASTLFAFLSFGTQDVEAQGKPRIVNVDSLHPKNINEKIGISILDNIIISGFVRNEVDSLVIPGVSINIKGTKNYVQAGMDGFYMINAKKGDILEFSMIGMISVEKIVLGENIMNVKMNEDLNSLVDVFIGFPSVGKNKNDKKK